MYGSDVFCGELSFINARARPLYLALTATEGEDLSGNLTYIIYHILERHVIC